MHIECLGKYLANDTGADRPATFSKSKSTSGLEGNVVNKLSHHLHVIAWHNELLVRPLGAFWPSERTGDIGRSQEQLWPVIRHEWGHSSTFVFGEDLSGQRVSKQSRSHKAEP